MPPRLQGLSETSLYVADLDRAKAFYRDVIGLAVMVDSPRTVALDAGSGGVLLLFRAGATSDDIVDAAGVIPGHEGAGRLHMAFAVAATEIEAWRRHFADHAVPLAGERIWSLGGRSLYVHDPDGHVIEFATPGVWPNR
jgi:catechol 2,3-dioxygenase-like lactoylglutathione lyase family enzyme